MIDRILVYRERKDDCRGSVYGRPLLEKYADRETKFVERIFGDYIQRNHRRTNSR